MKSLTVQVLALIAVIGMASPALSQHKPYIIGVGDILSVSIFAGGTTQESLDLEVSSKGTISFPFLGEIKAEGLSVTQLRETVTRPLAEDYFVNPQVFISVRDQKSKEANITHYKIYVLGKINSPGVYDFREGLTALDACIMAGGFAQYAAPNRTTITRREPPGKQEIIKINLDRVKKGKDEDLLLKPGDRIYVPESWL
jgi:protein involved in polysaccharide export with SLBB domain